MNRASRGVNGSADVELSITQYKKDKALNEGRPYRTKKAMDRTALHQLCQTLHGGKCSKELMVETRLSIVQGLDKKTMDIYTKKVDKIVANADPSKELLAMACGADFMPMTSETVSMRYSCRRPVCRMIPMRENQLVDRGT